jgi:hypothetical protein
LGSSPFKYFQQGWDNLTIKIGGSGISQILDAKATEAVLHSDFRELEIVGIITISLKICTPE